MALPMGLRLTSGAPAVTRYANTGLHSINEFGGFASVASPTTTIVPAFDAAVAALAPGQDLLLPFDSLLVDSSGMCSYWIDSPLELTKEINLVAESKRVQIKLKPGAQWGTTYCHAIRNWKHSDYSGATPTEVINQAPDVDTPGTLHHNIGSLDGMGFRVNLNGQSNVSAVSFVHLHEMSRISVIGTTGTSASSPYCWGNRVLSLFSNTGNVTAGPIYVEKASGYGFGWDHFMYADGTNGGTCTAWIQDLRYRDWVSMPQYTGNVVHWRHCVKSPARMIAVNGVSFNNTHTEAVPSTSPPAAGSGGWPGATTAVALGTRIFGVSASGANQGFGCIWSATTAGTTGGSQPAWPTPNSLTAPTNTVTDGSVVWQPCPYSAGLQSNGLGGVLDAACPWPGASIAVPKGTTISTDGTHGWICTTAGTTTSGAQPAFSTAGGRGTTQADGTAVWTYFLDDYDNAQFRFTDVAHPMFTSNRVSCAGFGSNRPMIKGDVTGTAPAQFYVYGALDIFGLDMEFGSIGVTNLTNAPKDGYMGKIVDTSTIQLAYSYATFDPRHIMKLTQWDVEFLHNKNLVLKKNVINGTPSTAYGLALLNLANQAALRTAVGISALQTYRQAQTLTPSATANTLGTAVPFTFDAGMTSVALRGNYANAVNPAGGEQLTVVITVTWSDTSTTTQTMTATTAGSTAVVNGTVNGIGASFYKDGLTVTAISAQVKSGAASSTATASLTLFGDNIV